MELIANLTDKDVGEISLPTRKFIERRAVRAVVFDKDGKVAVIKVEKDNLYKIPGGGVKEGEDLIDALRREVGEESGAIIRNIKELGMVAEKRTILPLIQESFCYTADAVRIEEPNFTEKEKDSGCSVLWMSVDDAIKAFEGVKPETYKSKFVSKREFIILKKAIRARKENL